MDMKHRLTCVGVAVEHRPIPPVGMAKIFRNQRRPSDHLTDEAVVIGRQVVQGRDMYAGDEQYVGGGLRVDVVERDDLVVVIDHVGGDIATHDFAEKAVGHVLLPIINAQCSVFRYNHHPRDSL